MSDAISREFVTLWVSESLARQRVNLEALSHFVSALAREVHRWVEHADELGELDVACALLPNGRLLIDAQFAPHLPAPKWLGPLREQLEKLAAPPVRTLPVAFSCRVPVGEGEAARPGTFRVPFTTHASDWRGSSMERLILTAATRRGLWTSIEDVDITHAGQVTRLPEEEDSEGAALKSGSFIDARSGFSGRSGDSSRSGTGRRLRRAVSVGWSRVWRALLGWWRARPAPPAEHSSSTAPLEAPSTAPPPALEAEANALHAHEEASSDAASDAEDPLEPLRIQAETARERGDYARAIDLYSQLLTTQPGDEEAHLARGAARCIAGETRAGLDDFNALLAVDPGHVAARYNRGILLIELEAYAAAVDDFTQAIEHDPWSPRLWVARGRARALQREFALATDDFTRAIELDPHDDEPYALRAACARFLASFPESAAAAIEDYTRAIEIMPDRAAYFLQRGEQYWVRDEHDLALADCDRALACDPQLAAARGLRGAVLVSLDRYAEAEADCTEALEQGATAANIFLTRAEARMARESWDEALEDVEAALERAPELSAAWKCRSLIRLRLGMAEESLADLNEALRLAPEQVTLWCHRAALYRHQKRPLLAISDCERALELAPDFPPALLIRAGCWEDQDERDKAAADLDRLIELAPDDLHSRLERANFWLRGDAYDRALVDFDVVLAQEPDNVSARFHRGQILAAQGELERALADLSRAIELDPEFAPAYARRANVWLILGNREEAHADYDRAEQIDPESADQFRLMRCVDEAHCHLQRGDVAASLESAEAALELAPDHPPALHARILALIASEEHVDALAELERLQTEVGESPTLEVYRGQILAELGEYEPALASFDRALADDPEGIYETSVQRGLAHAGRAFVRAGLGDDAGAEQDFIIAIRQAPSAGLLYYQQGRVYHQRGDSQAAAHCFRLALIVDRPTLPVRLRERAAAYVRRVDASSG